MLTRIIEFFTSCKSKIEAAYQRGFAEGFTKAKTEANDLDPHLVEKVVFTVLRMQANSEKSVKAYDRAQNFATKEYREKLAELIANTAPITPQIMDRIVKVTERGADLNYVEKRKGGLKEFLKGVHIDTDSK